MPRKLKNGWPITKRKKLPAQWIAKPFKGFLSKLCFQKAKETEDTSADY